MSTLSVEVKDELDVETEDVTEEEACSENYQDETTHLGQISRDPLDIVFLKSESSSDEERNNIQAKSTKETRKEKEIFRCNICNEVYFMKLEFFRHKYSHTQDKNFTCLICHYIFKTKMGILDHMLVFHKNVLEFNCNICHVRFATREELEYHRKKHENLQDRPFKCGLCSLCFVTKAILNTHKMTHSIKRSIACDICHRQCASIVALANHKRSHELIKCDRCPKLFDRNNLNRHKKRVHSLELFKCSICLETFDNVASLNTHKFNHIGNPVVFECTVCYKKFENIVKRNKHELIHNKEKIYECDKCGKRYQYFSQLQKHYRDHPDHTKNKDVNKDKDYKPIECNICHKRYTQLVGLRNHMKTHTEQKDYKCDICHKRFYTKYVLRDHLRVHTGEKPFKCKVCPKKFRTGTNLNYHLATHSKDKKFVCATCDKQYTRKGKLLEHIRKIHSRSSNNQGIRNRIRHQRITVKITLDKTRKLRNNPTKAIEAKVNPEFECTVCHRRFKLKHSLLLHRVVHKTEMTYDCDICYMRLEGKTELKRHKKVHSRRSVDIEKKTGTLHSYTLFCNNVMTTVVNPLSLKQSNL